MDDSVGRAIGIAMVAIDLVWSELRQTPSVQRHLGMPIDRLPDISEQAVMARSQRAKEALALIADVDESRLPHELALTVAVARATAERMAKEGDWYWLVFDPMGIGFFALFGPTAYAGGFLLTAAGAMLAQHRFEQDGDLDRYLGLISDYGRLLDQLTQRTAGQSERGIHIPRPQLEQSIEFVSRLRTSAPKALVPDRTRLPAATADRHTATITTRVTEVVEPAFERLLGLLTGSQYQAAAPEKAGIGQYPGGEDVYRELVRQHLTLDLTPAQVHEEGVQRVAAVRAAMAKLLGEIGFVGSPEDYLAHVNQDPEWRAEGAEGVANVFRRYIDRIAPYIDEYFRFKPLASHDVAALPASLAGSMTFGYYDPSSKEKPVGRYMFNAENLGRNALSNIAALNYHELVPGHHLHFASQRENEALHPVRAYAFFNAFNEGWAEYAATLAGEMGMYHAPEERFGRLIMDAFLTCRLVVDTGMNALGWSLEQARDYMRANAFMPESEVKSESIRYSCDMPGQSLAYKLGEHFLMEQREAMRSKLGNRFDIRDFHDAVLKPGALPLALVSRNVEAATAGVAAQVGEAQNQ